MAFDRATEIQVQSTILTPTPAVYGLKQSAIKAIKRGERVKVDADDGPVEILD
jgi:predicted aconitase with swiveling domain